MKRSSPKALWPFFLCVSIAIFYTLGPLFVHLPLAILGRFSKTCWRLSGIVFCFGVKYLLFFQPWIKFKRDFDLPDYDKPVIIISNHRSNLDVFYFLSAVPNIRILSKKMFFKIPVFGIGLWLLKLIPVVNYDFEIYREALKKVKQILVKERDPVLFFPEMTRCKEGFIGIGKFSLAPFQTAIESKAQILPAIVVATDLSWPKGTFGGRFREPTMIKSLDLIDSSNFDSARALQIFVRETMIKELDKYWKAYGYDS